MANSGKEKTSIEGILLMLDDRTPHVAVPIQAICDGDLVATVFSNEWGRYQFINLKPGRYQVRCQILGGYVYYGEKKTVGNEGEVLEVKQDVYFPNIDFRIPPFKKGTWRYYDVSDGLAGIRVHAVHKSPDGALWFGSGSFNNMKAGSGVCRYDGKKFTTFTTADGLPSNSILAIHSDRDDMMWFGTWGSGVSRYDGKEFVNFTTEDGLASDHIYAINSTPDAIMWFGTHGGGVCRYDGKEFVSFTTKDGLLHNTVHTIHVDPDGIIWFGTQDGVSRYDGKEFVHFTTEDGLAGSNVFAIHRSPDGIMWFGTGRTFSPGHGVSRYDGKEFVTFTTKDGLLSDTVQSINNTPDGVVWFGTDGGVSRYDGKTFVNFRSEFLDSAIDSIHVESDGSLWFATGTGGVARYDEKSFITLTAADGLPNRSKSFIQATYRDPDGFLWVGARSGVTRYDSGGIGRLIPTTLSQKDGVVPGPVSVIHRAPDGKLWFGTGGSHVVGRGIFLYDSNIGNDTPPSFINFTTRDGLAHNRVFDIQSSPDGLVWIATFGGVSQYDGREFLEFAIESIKNVLDRDDDRIKAIRGLYRDPDGVTWFGSWDSGVFRYDALDRDDDRIKAIRGLYRDPDGVMWFGSWGSGVFRYDGKEFVNFTTEDGLANNDIYGIHGDPNGIVWFATHGGGVSRYDGNEFLNFTTKDGLTGNETEAVYCTPDGVVWVGSYGGGVSGYDGAAWTSLDTRYGLADNRVFSISMDPDGSLWFGTREGATCYRRSITPPRVYIVSVIADRIYHDLLDIPAFTLGTRVTVEYNAIDFRTLPEERQYRCRIMEMDSDWRKPTKSDTFDFVFDKPGIYTFEVQAIDRDLNYSEPASVKLEVIPDPRNHRIIQLEAHIHEQELAELKRVQQELEDARQIQQSLLPEKPPVMEGFQIASISNPAKEVSGDFYSYLSLGNNTGIVLADVTGKSVKAAMVAAMTNGMLNEAVNAQSELWNSPGAILNRLNAGLQPHLIRGMFTAMSMGIIQPEKKKLIFSNAGMPYPIVKRGSELWEMEVTGMPLGLMSGAEYEDLSIELEANDLVIFCSDGVIEAENEAGDMYQTERLLRTIQQADLCLSAQDMVDLILKDVIAFVGDEEASDDITIVVLRCEA